LKIVIAEDDHFQLKLLSEKFSMLGYRDIAAFDDGPTALAHCTSSNHFGLTTS
jgi:CheY-like chemotaxis protein